MQPCITKPGFCVANCDAIPSRLCSAFNVIGRKEQGTFSPPEHWVVIRNFVLFYGLGICRPQEIDEAARRRLVKRLYIPLPDQGARQQIVMRLLTKQAASVTAEEAASISEMTSGEGSLTCCSACAFWFIAIWFLANPLVYTVFFCLAGPLHTFAVSSSTILSLKAWHGVLMP